MKKTKKIIIFSNTKPFIHRDLYETGFFKKMDNDFNVKWLFDREPKYKLKKKLKNYKVLGIIKNYRNLFWSYLYYLEEMTLFSKFQPSKVYKNAKLYISSFHRNFISLIFFLKFDKIVKYICVTVTT